jgi:hypothetical protein
MFKPTPSLQGTLRRLPLSTKQAGKEYYKGNRVGSMGTINRYGNFTPDWNKIRTYVFPVQGVKNAEVGDPSYAEHEYDLRAASRASNFQLKGAASKRSRAKRVQRKLLKLAHSLRACYCSQAL